MAELSEAGAHYGRAFCVPADRIGLPLDQLSPQERACVESVGEGWQERVEEKLGAGIQTNAPIPDVYLKVMRGEHQIGNLRLVGGTVTLCLPTTTCEVVGHGIDAIAAAETTLNHMGLETEPLS